MVRLIGDCLICAATSIHATASVHPNACLEEGVSVGPYCVVGSGVTLKAGVRLHAHSVIEGHTTVGQGCEIFPFAAVGCVPQDKKYAGESSRLEIGARTVVREHATLHPGTYQGGMVTRVGNDCLLMVGTHIAHDCKVGNHVVCANQATLGGHVCVGDYVTIGGLAAIHQFVRIGEGAFIAGTAGISRDVVPYGATAPAFNVLAGLNLVGLRRRSIKSSDILGLQQAYQATFLDNQREPLDQRILQLESALLAIPVVKKFSDFLCSAKRPLCLPA